MRHPLTLFTIVALCIALPARAQTKAVEAEVQSVNDRRSSGSFSSLDITVRLPAIKSSQVAGSRVLLRSAVDDSGASLMKEPDGEIPMETNLRGPREREGANDPPVSISFNLENPSRRATSVKEVRAEVELFMPAKDPNSIAEIPKFLSSAGKPMNHKALKANGVEIVVVSKAQIDAERKKVEAAKRKEYKEIGYEDGEQLDEMVSSVMSYTLNFEPNDVPVRIKDPNKRIHEVAYVDGAGEEKRVVLREEENGLGVISTWGDPPGPDWKLRVSMKTSKNIVRHSFALKDVKLP